MSYQLVQMPFGVEIKRLADNVFIAADPGNSDYRAYLEWIAEGNVAEAAVEAPHEAAYSESVQRLLDSTAKANGYDDIKSAVGYADEPAVAKFQLEGQALRRWRSLVWAACYQILGEVQAGARAVPSVNELLSELPAYEPPVSA